MKKLFTILFVSILSLGYSQNSISGIIIDSKTKEPLPFASILINEKLGTISETDGKFKINTKFKITEIKASYIGYDTKIIEVDKGKTYFRITLNSNSNLLNEVVLIDERVNPAIGIIRKTIANKDRNNPEKSLKSYTYDAYNKFVVTANPDSIIGTIDTVWTKTKGELVFKKVDSSNYTLKKNLLKSHVYLSEKISTYRFKQGDGVQQEVLASRMAGFKEPINELFAMQLQSLSFYDEFYTVMGDEYLNPISNNRVFKEYDYKILDTLNNSVLGRTFMIYFKPKKKKETAGLEGVIYISEHNFAVQKAIVELKAIIRITATMNFKYIGEQDIWFPVGTDLLIRKGNSEESMMLLGSKIKLQQAEVPDSLKNDVKQNSDFNASDYLYLSSINKNINIEINPEVEIKSVSIAVVVDDDAHKKSEEFWNEYRTEPITTRGTETYVVVDSVFEAEGVNKKINLLRGLSTGYYSLGYFDLNLNRILDYNKYEGFRVGLGGRTSAELSTKFNVEGYGAYGFGDYAIKGSLGVNFRLDKMTNTWLGASYTYDINPSSRTVFITDNNSFFMDDLNKMNNSYFNSFTSSKIYVRHNLLPNLKTKLLLEKTYSRAEYNYSFDNNGIESSYFDLSIMTLGVEWEPYSKFIQTRYGRKRMHNGYPKFTGQYTQSVKGLFNGEYDFSKIDLRVKEQFNTYGWGTTEMLLIGGVAFGDTPLSYLYGGNPNSYLNEPWINRVNFSGSNSFETMLYGEFFSDKYIEFHLRQRFEEFDIRDGFKPQLSLVTRVAYGTLGDVSVHKNISFKTLERGFFESGIEFDKIFQGLGIGTYFRYGANQNAKWDDNLFVKISYKISLF